MSQTVILQKLNRYEILKTNVQNGGVRGWNEEDQLQQWQLVVAKTTSLKFNATEAKRGNHDWL